MAISNRTAGAGAEPAGLRPWREVLRPHEDVATGTFQAAEFAADLWTVARGDASSDYADPVRFFARTYLTEGLRDLVGRAVRRLAGDDNASPVINLQTRFGGGKTHSMLALWHLAGGTGLGDLPRDTRELLEPIGYAGIRGARRVAIVGNHFAATGETKPDGTLVRTVWGELAWQLGGPEGYALVADADRAGTNPGRALHDLLAACSPAVILIDEWVAYARQLPDRPDEAAAARITGGTFGTQFTFAQSLTEAAKATSGVLLAISIPASGPGQDEVVAGDAGELGGRRGLEALQRLQNVVRRVADQWRPASATESCHIVRQRLFAAPDAGAPAEIGATARAFAEFYRRHGDEFPRETRDGGYEDRIRLTYPVHPELFDRLYEDWSGLERFQRTRGVLRLMNTVVRALWAGADTGPLIMPGSIPLGTAAVSSELTQYLPDSWRSIIEADVDGPDSAPARIDREKPLLRSGQVTRRLARTVFLGAAPAIGSAHQGLDRRRVFLGTAIPGDIPGNFHSALAALGDRATHFCSGSGRYWYDLRANITRRVREQADRLPVEDVWAEVRRRLADQAERRGDFAGVHVCPDDTGDIPDIDEARLVILHPGVTHRRGDDGSTAMRFARSATEQRGTAQRAHRNMLVFLAADGTRRDELEAAVRDFLGWSHVLDRAGEFDLSRNERDQAADRKRQADATVGSRLLGTYHWALVPQAPDPASPFVLSATKAEGRLPSLAERVSQRLGADGALATRQAAATIRHWLDRLPKLWESGHVRVGDLWRQYTTYVYMPRLRDRSVLIAGIADQPPRWQEDGFAVAVSHDGERYAGLTCPPEGAVGALTDATLLVRPDLAAAQREQRSAAEPVPDPQSRPRHVFFRGTKTLDAQHCGSGFTKVMDEVLQHLAAAPGVNLTVRVEIEAEAADGFSDFQVRTVSENSDALEFDQARFE